MSIRKRILEAKRLGALGEFDAALILTIVAIAGASRLQIPVGSDADAFITYIDRRIAEALSVGPVGANPVAIALQFKGKTISIGRALYKEFRCNLLHEAGLPDGIKFNAADITLSTAVSDDKIVLGRGWLFFLIEAVIGDPELVPLFDDLRPMSHTDVYYIGAGTQEEFETQFFIENSFSAGRMQMLKSFVATVGPNLLRQMSDDYMRRFWTEEVTRNPRNFGMVNVTGFCSTYYQPPGPPANWTPWDDEKRAFLNHDRAYPNPTYTLTDAGLHILRAVLELYVVKAFGEPPHRHIPPVQKAI